ncbi:unnamed protein product, partial [Brassica rapa]
MVGEKDVFTQISKDVVGLLYKTFFFIRPVMLTLESFFVRVGLIVRRIFR